MYGTFDETGRVSGFYSDDVFPPDEEGNRNAAIPVNAIPLDQETYNSLFEYQDGYRLVDGVIVSYTPPPPTPEERREAAPPVTARQFRLALVRNSITLASVEEAINALPDEQERSEQMIEWEYGALYKRLDPLVTTITNANSLTLEQMDAIWIEAVAIV